jgi:putative ABC transport system substrate-binding protein
VEGQNIFFERRYLAGRAHEFGITAKELAEERTVDMIVVWGGAAAEVVRSVKNTMPVLFLAGPSVETGLVASLAHPGGNVTGITFHASKHLTLKHIEILREILPRVAYAGVLYVPLEDPPGGKEETETAARSLGLKLLMLPLREPNDLHAAFAEIEKQKPQALIAAPSGLLYAFRQTFIDFAAKNRLPVVYGLREVVTDGGLISLSPNLLAIARRGAYYVDRICRGAKPADLPVEQPTAFELVINARTAKTLGLTIPPSLLARADETIQ